MALIQLKMLENRLRWFSHVLCASEESVAKRALQKFKAGKVVEDLANSGGTRYVR